jgi:hypothetical protein
MGMMTEAVIRMPYEMAMSDELTRIQFYQRANNALDELLALRQQLAEQTSGESLNHEREEIAGEHLDDIIVWLKERGLYDDIDYQDEGPDFPAILTMHENELIAQEPSVEVLLEALRLAKVTFIANKMDVRNVMEVIDDALNAYSSKPQKHLDN